LEGKVKGSGEIISAGALLGPRGSVMLDEDAGRLLNLDIGVIFKGVIRRTIRGDFGGTAGGSSGFDCIEAADEGAEFEAAFTSPEKVSAAAAFGKRSEDVLFRDLWLLSSNADGASVFSVRSGDQLAGSATGASIGS
jgi:hypothetical protein